MIIDFIIEDLMLNSYLQKNFHTLGRDVADPWYTGDFDTTWSDVTEGCAALLDYILERI